MVTCVRKPVKVKTFCVGLSFEDSLHIPAFNSIVSHATHHEIRRHVFVEPVEYWLRIVSQDIDAIDSHNCAAQRQASAGARDGVKGERRTLAVRAPLHALVRLPSPEGHDR